MAEPRKPSNFARAHGAIWYGSLAYRLSWLALPQALAALVLALFFMGGGIGDLSFGGGNDPATPVAQDWAKPLDMTATEEALNKLRDAAADGDEKALAELAQLAEGGDDIAGFKLGTLYSPYFSSTFLYPNQKDAARAVTLMQPAADAGFWKALGALGDIYLTEPAPLQDMAKGCDYMIRYEQTPERRALGWADSDISRMVNSANCLLNELRPDGVAHTEPSLGNAEHALTILEDPALASDTLALWSRVKLLTRPGSLVFNQERACPAAEAWANLTTPETRRPEEYYILTAAALCKTNGFDNNPAVPPNAAQEEALKILSSAELRNDENAQSNLAWLLFKPWDVADPVKACQAVESWAAIVGNDKASIDGLSTWTAIKFTDCLIGVHPGQQPRTPSPQDMQLVLAIAQSAADRGSVDGEYIIGQINQFGTGGQPVNAAEAMKRYESCAAAGGDLCNWRLGSIYAYANLGIPKDLKKAVEYFKLCAKVGNANCDAELAFAYRMDTSLNATADEIQGHLRKSADAGVSLGAEHLAYAYYKGDHGLPVDMDSAASWLIKSITMPGGSVVRDWLAGKPDALKSDDFWKAFHRELTRLGAYTGPISSKATTETVAALFKI